MTMRQISINDKLLFEKFLQKRHSVLSAYSFENIFLWKGLYSILWTIQKNQLCIFFQDVMGCFLYLPPLGDAYDHQVVLWCFAYMNERNKNVTISRIENIEPYKRDVFESAGFEMRNGCSEYIYGRRDLAMLQGNRFKQKRWSVNRFEKDHDIVVEAYDQRYQKECSALFERWMHGRMQHTTDSLYRSMLRDSQSVFESLLCNFNALAISSCIIRIDDTVRACLFGYQLNADTVVVLFEVCDLDHKGIAQYIFREFCKRQDARFINCMDDSMLENIRRTKTSYRPQQIIPKYSARSVCTS